MLNKKEKYLQIALNNTLEEARLIIKQLPLDKRIILEAGTPLIKRYGAEAIRTVKEAWRKRIFGFSFEERNLESFFYLNFFEKSFQKKTVLVSKNENFEPYIVADLKCMDRGGTEVEIAKRSGASAAICLGQAPIETINVFIEECEKFGLDSMIDMMNVEFPLNILRTLKKPPKVVILHRGVDEENFDPESEIPFHEIARIKNEYDVMVAVAGGDTIQEVQRAIFNDADIVVVWKSFYKSTSETAKLAEEFLKEIR